MLFYCFISCRCFNKFPRNTLRLASSSSPHSFIPTASSSKHRDLPTFLGHAQSATLSPTSTVHVGTSYEYLCAHTLLRLGFTNLTRTGGRSDRGIDLLGHWKPPPFSPTSGGLPVIIQCKATARKPGPDMIRELEGAVAGAPGEWRDVTTIGVLCAKREATDGVRQAVKRSRRGIVWIMVENLDEEPQGLVGEGNRGRVKQVLWNQRVGKIIGERSGAGLRYVTGKQGMEKEVCLTLDGKVWEPDMIVRES